MNGASCTDIGANLLHPQFDRDREDVIARAHAAGVARMIITCSNLDESERAIEFCGNGRHARLWCTAGVHPHEAKDTSPDWSSRLAALAASPLVKAVGEMGLDFNRNFSPPERQVEVFHAQLELATQIGKPAFVHDRDSAGKVFEMLSEHASDLSGVVVHCFTGTARDLRRYLDAGFYIGITGWVCDERRGQTLRDIVSDIPLDQLLVETDAPFLMPQVAIGIKTHSKNKKRNEPAMLGYVIKKIAELQHREPAEIARATHDNASILFDLDDGA